MKIMIVIPRMNNGGAERVAANLANGLAVYDSVFLVSLVGNESFYELNTRVDFKSANINVGKSKGLKRKIMMGLGLIPAINYVKYRIQEFRPEVIISFLYEADLLAFYFKTRYPDILWISSERNDPTVENITLRITKPLIYKKTDLFVCQSKFISDYYRDVRKKTVIPNLIDISSLPNQCAESDRLRIVSVGRLSDQKNHMLLLKCFNNARKAVKKPCILEIYGEGPKRKDLEKFITENDLNECVCLPGSKKNVLELIKDASLFVLSSDYEGFPNALVEAVAIGLPSISTDFKVGTAREILPDSRCVVPVNDEDKLTRAMILLMENDDLRNSYRGKYSEIIKTKYDRSVIVRRWRDAIYSIIHSK